MAAAAAPVLSLRLSAASSGSPATWWDRTFLSLQSAGLTEWRATLGQTFTLTTPNGSNLLRIAAVTAFPRSGARPATLGRSQAFFVVFESVAGPSLPRADSVYQLAHASYPPLPIYMSAPSTVAGKTRLIAVFN